jgi:hypothetical protein
MSTKSSLKFEHNEATGQMAHLYREVFDEGQVCVHLARSFDLSETTPGSEPETQEQS